LYPPKSRRQHERNYYNNVNYYTSPKVPANKHTPHYNAGHSCTPADDQQQQAADGRGIANGNDATGQQQPDYAQNSISDPTRELAYDAVAFADSSNNNDTSNNDAAASNDNNDNNGSNNNDNDYGGGGNDNNDYGGSSNDNDYGGGGGNDYGGGDSGGCDSGGGGDSGGGDCGGGGGGGGSDD
jgi:hypothetical protein